MQHDKSTNVSHIYTIILKTMDTLYTVNIMLNTHVNQVRNQNNGLRELSKVFIILGGYITADFYDFGVNGIWYLVLYVQQFTKPSIKCPHYDQSNNFTHENQTIVTTGDQVNSVQGSGSISLCVFVQRGGGGIQSVIKLHIMAVVNRSDQMNLT